ncbi:MAG: hypothetical protein IT262_05165 [Saprospiraceae bacterium]|nr:hypothetical protein [Saprospiraceae bacterium]
MKYSMFLSVVFFAAWFLSCQGGHTHQHADAAQTAVAGARYQCPMDCEKGKLYEQPGTCPVCNMDLQAVQTGATAQTYVVALATEPAAVAAGKPVQLRFTPGIAGKPGEAVPLDVVHEKKMHLILVSEDLSWFDHQHPEYNGTGLDLAYTFPQGGQYFLFADYKPAGAGHQVEKLPLRVSGPAPQPVTYAAARATVLVDGYEVSLTPMGGKWLTNKALHITGQVKKAGRPLDVSDFENYLGAKAHVVLVGLEDKTYEHVHPDVQAGAFDLHTTFAKPGLYRMWMQFQTEGKVHTADFVLAVEE